MKNLSKLIDKLHLIDVQKPEFLETALEIQHRLSQLNREAEGTKLHEVVASTYSNWAEAVEQGTLGAYNRATKEVTSLIINVVVSEREAQKKQERIAEILQR